MRRCPDSRDAPEELLTALLKLGGEIGQRSVIFPTRDDDCLFLDRFRSELSKDFIPVLPPSPALRACLNKWETYLLAKQAGVPTPRCYLVENQEHLRRVSEEVTFPCVLKPVSSHDWRRAANWELVGARKAIGILSQEELLAEYVVVARADQRALIQEMVPGDDDCLMIAACYLDGESNWVAGFNTQKLVQSPAGFGTGCIVQTVDRPDLFAPSLRLLHAMRFTGIAEVEYKWDARSDNFQLIEVNPRPWDQHRLGNSSGLDLVYLAYCEHAGMPSPVLAPRLGGHKWIAEDAFFMAVLRLAWRRDPKLWSIIRLARGNRVYAIWSWKDPLPGLVYLVASFLPGLVSTGTRFLWSALTARRRAKAEPQERGTLHDSHLAP